MNSVGIVSFRDVSFFQMNVGFRDFSPIYNRCSRDEILYCESLDFKWFSFVFAGMRNKPEWTVADDSRKLMFRTNLRCAKPFFTKSLSTFASLTKDPLWWQLVVLLSNRPVVFSRKVIQEFSVMLLSSWRLFSLWRRYDRTIIVRFGCWVSSVNSTDNCLMCVFETSSDSFASAFFSVVLWRTPLALSFYLALSLRRALFETSFA